MLNEGQNRVAVGFRPDNNDMTCEADLRTRCLDVFHPIFAECETIMQQLFYRLHVFKTVAAVHAAWRCVVSPS